MASQSGLRTVDRQKEDSDSSTHMDPDINYLNELTNSATWWRDRDKHSVQEDSLREHLRETDEHVARLQDMFRSEQAKCTRLQLQCKQQEAQLQHRELQINRLKERLSQLTDRHRDRGPSIEVLNLPNKFRNKREQAIKPLKAAVKHEDTALRVMLERREAELREAMKLRHSLTSLLHSLRVDMEQTLADSVEVPEDGGKSLDEAEATLGEYVTGGVVQSWRQAQKRLQDVSSDGQSGRTDHEKLLAQLVTDLEESRELARLQQQLLQDSLVSPVPSELADSYFLEELERLHMRRAEFNRQKRTFERERQHFTDAAIRLSRERRDFEQQKASLQKQLYLSDLPGSNKETSTSGFSSGCTSGCLPTTPTSLTSPVPTADPGSTRAEVGVRTPSTPELYSELDLSYDCRSREVPHHSVDNRINGTLQTQNLNQSF